MIAINSTPPPSRMVSFPILVSYEAKLIIERFGEEYVDYMKRVPRYFLIKG
jgi:protein-S-isoprenylcysteine O-methyltransferase Ste14